MLELVEDEWQEGEIVVQIKCVASMMSSGLLFDGDLEKRQL